MTPSSTLAIGLSQQAQYGEVRVACGGARIRTTLPPSPLCGRGSSLDLGSTGGQSPASRGYKGPVRVTLRCPYTRQLPLASHPLLFARTLGDRSSRDQACDHFTAAVDGGRCRRGVLRLASQRRTVRRDHHGCRRRFACRSPSPGCCSGCSRSRNFGLNSDLARFRIKVAIPIVCVTAVVVSVWFIQNSMFVPVSWLVLLVAAP